VEGPLCEEAGYQYLQKQRPCSIHRAGKGRAGLTEDAGGRLQEGGALLFKRGSR